jgi:hypothetical protein
VEEQSTETGESPYSPEVEKGRYPAQTRKAAKPSVNHGGEHTSSVDGSTVTARGQKHAARNRKGIEKIFQRGANQVVTLTFLQITRPRSRLNFASSPYTSAIPW